MMGTTVVYSGGPIFDGQDLREGGAAVFEEGRFVSLLSASDMPEAEKTVTLDGEILAPGYVDLQVNGGDGVMLNDDPSVGTLARIALAHRRLGTLLFLPTLITDTPEKTEATIAATRAAIESGVPGITGLHLEGPHLSVARKGAHDAALIRPMTERDLAMLLAAQAALPVLKVTLAPENASLQQVVTLAKAGVLVSLGHTDADYATCLSYVQAGARLGTHLFNAMSQLGNREPGLVGAVLDSSQLSCGVIADSVHVHPATLRAAWRAKRGPGRLFLVSDAMAVAGTGLSEFHLEGRKIVRRNGRLTLEDGTLAGADLDLTRAVQTLVEDVRLPLAEALQAAITTPADLIGMPWRLMPGVTRLEDMIRITPDLTRAKPVLL